MSKTLVVVLQDDVVSRLDGLRALSRRIRSRSAIIHAAVLNFLENEKKEAD